ncbi:hypothetical protein [Actinoalloteichus fjordicus]|uniref:hypothetical protein n=1 Tax=Actinoalloteichus TaxID=65496 RepID=UPI00384D6C6C
MLGYDKSYVSMIETGRRAITDVRSRRHIARVLGLPAHALGVTESDDADVAAMLQFAGSTLRLATLARQAGRAADAAAELWPLVARLEAAQPRAGSTGRRPCSSDARVSNSASRSARSFPRSDCPRPPGGPVEVCVSLSGSAIPTCSAKP